MKTKKLTLANIKGKLSRTEMKNIMAGSGGDPGNYYCTETAQCVSAFGPNCVCLTGIHKCGCVE